MNLVDTLQHAKNVKIVLLKKFVQYAESQSKNIIKYSCNLTIVANLCKTCAKLNVSYQIFILYQFLILYYDHMTNTERQIKICVKNRI